MIQLIISEEYGRCYWQAELTEQEYSDLIARWRTMRGLTCLVPLQVVIPQAKEFDLLETPVPKGAKRCNFHEWYDSHLEGSDYRIPVDECFWIDGQRRPEYSL